MQRKTEQREAIRQAFQDTNRPLSVHEVLSLAQGHVPKLGIATVYRNLKSLVASEWLITVELPGEPSRYERAGLPHHHYFSCRSCERVFDVNACLPNIDTIIPKGYVLERHEIILYGQCADCLVVSA